MLGSVTFACSGLKTEVNDPAKDKEESDLIIVGTINKQEGFEDPKSKYIYTNVTFKNVQTLKGETANTTILELFGGSITYSKGGKFQSASCNSKIHIGKIGQKCLVCLKKHESKKEIYILSGDQENCQIQDIAENQKKFGDAVRFFSK